MADVVIPIPTITAEQFIAFMNTLSKFERSSFMEKVTGLFCEHCWCPARPGAYMRCRCRNDE